MNNENIIIIEEENKTIEFRGIIYLDDFLDFVDEYFEDREEEISDFTITSNMSNIFLN